MTQEEKIQIVKQNATLPYDELAKLIGVGSGDKARGFCRYHKIFPTRKPTRPNDKVEDIIGQKKQRAENRKDKKEREMLLNEIDRLYRTNEAILKITETPQIFQIEKPAFVAKSEATAFIVASDWHYEEEVKSSTVSGLNKYNLEVADKRINNFSNNSMTLFRIFEKDVKIPNIVLSLLGDFISGSIHDELIELNQLKPIDAIWQVQNRILGYIYFLLNNTKAKIIIVCHPGNHSRLTDHVHFSAEQGNSLEYYMYHNLAKLLEKESRVEFVIAEGYHTHLKVYDKTIRFHHGHALKYAGGVGGIYIPVNKSIAQWNMGVQADLDVFGHFHQMRDGDNFICNGSMIGYSGYALSIKARYEEPKQAMFLVDSKRGKTFVAPIFLDKN